VAISLDEYMESRRRLVDDALQAWIPKAPELPESLAAAMHYAVFPGGKRLRPVLVLLAAESASGTESVALPAACAVELVHCYSLAHDDLPAMDDDDLRRGRPTCHKKFGEATAILAGDALLTLAFEVLARDSSSAELATASCRELAAAAGAGGMVGGQADDIAATVNDPARVAVETLKSIHSRKTGALLAVCVRLGGLAAEADAATMRALDAFGREIGLAFQVADDLLDAAGDESKTGKRVGKDSGRGKLTFPYTIGIDASRHMARELCDRACAALDPLGPQAERLRELARFVVERDR
jgi:geranylgeranyl diphosphate synthase type II